LKKILLLLSLILLQVTPQTAFPTVLFAEPYAESVALAALPAYTPLTLEGRDESGQWLLVKANDGHGWMMTGSLLLPIDFTIRDLPISTERFADPMPLSEEYPPETASKLQRLLALPLLYNTDTEQVREIYRRGQALGNRSDVFIKIGDSNTANGDFFRPFGLSRETCDFGAYSYLQETVDYYSTPPRTGFDDSFDSKNFTVVVGLTTVGLLDSFWATDPLCQPNESLLSCEHRVVKPSISISMVGLMDLEYYTTEVYAANLEKIVAQSVEQGVIPVQTTFTVLPDYVSPEMPLWDKALDYNIAIIDVAEKYGTPVIHLWKALQTLSDYGVGPDRTHLKASVGEYCSFTGEEQLYGGTMRNLLSLQALDEIRRTLETE
jgi:hypothetical protein